MAEFVIQGYEIALLALMGCVLLIFRDYEPMRRTALTIAAIYTLQVIAGWYFWPGLGWSWIAAALDIAGCIIVTRKPSGRWQAIVGGTFLLQIGCHTGRIISELNTGHADLNLYWWSVAIFGIVQLLLFGGWLGDTYRRRRLSGNSGDSLQALPTHREIMG